MIEINLLPGAKKKRGGKAGGFKMPDVKALAASVKDPWLIACLAGWVLVAALIGLFYLPRRSAVEALRPKLEQARREAARLESVLRTKTETESKRDSLLRQIDIIRSIDRERYIWPHVLEAVTKAVPPYTWLDDIASRSDPGDSSGASNVSLQLSGKSADIQAITRFVRNLEESPFMENAVLVNTAVITDRGREVTNFLINVQYQQPDSTLLTMQPLAASLVQGYRSGAVRGR